MTKATNPQSPETWDLTVDPDVIIIGEATAEQIAELKRMPPPEPVTIDLGGVQIHGWTNAEPPTTQDEHGQ